MQARGSRNEDREGETRGYGPFRQTEPPSPTLAALSSSSIHETSPSRVVHREGGLGLAALRPSLIPKPVRSDGLEQPRWRITLPKL
jgi:hypothetical protein